MKKLFCIGAVLAALAFTAGAAVSSAPAGSTWGTRFIAQTNSVNSPAYNYLQIVITNAGTAIANGTYLAKATNSSVPGVFGYSEATFTNTTGTAGIYFNASPLSGNYSDAFALTNGAGALLYEGSSVCDWTLTDDSPTGAMPTPGGYFAIASFTNAVSPVTEVVRPLIAYPPYLFRMIDRVCSNALSGVTSNFNAGLLNGVPAYAPGSSYIGGFYLGDIAFAIPAIRGQVSSNTLYMWIYGFATNQNASTGQIPDGLKMNSTVNNNLSGALDSYAFVDMVYQHYLNCGTTIAYSNFWLNVSNALRYVKITNSLVWSAAGDCEFYASDGNTGTGYSLRGSLYRYKVYQQLATLAAVQNDINGSSNYYNETIRIQTNLDSVLWDPSRGLYRQFSNGNNTHDLWGSLLSVVWGEAGHDQTVSIANAFVSSYGTTNFFLNGAVRQIPADETDRYSAGQACSYYTIATPWAAQVLAYVRPDYAVQLMTTAITNQMAWHGYEYFGTSGSGSNYLSAVMTTRYYLTNTLQGFAP